MTGKKVILISDIKASHDLFLPLSILSIATVLQREGYHSVILDGQVESQWVDKLRHEVLDASIVGISSHTGASILAGIEAVRVSREVKPSVPIVWGGYHATQGYRGILSEGFADYVVRGPGEQAVVELLRAIESDSLDKSVSNIPNLVYIEEGEPQVNPFQSIDMNELPPMDYELLDIDRYFKHNRRVLHYVSSYGCPHACTYCAEPAQSLRRWKGLHPERLVNEIVDLWERYRPSKISFVDPNISSNPNRIVKMVRIMKSRNLCIPMRASMKASDIPYISKYINLRDLRGIGFSKLFIGVESGSDRMLKALRKGSTKREMYEVCKLLSDCEIGVIASFMHDLPGESYEDSDETFDLVESLCRLPNIEQSHHFYMPYPSTELYSEMMATGQIDESEKTLKEWATASTFRYQENDIWSGRQDFRERVMKRLNLLANDYPEAISTSINMN